MGKMKQNQCSRRMRWLFAAPATAGHIECMAKSMNTTTVVAQNVSADDLGLY